MNVDLPEAIRAAIDSRLAQAHVALPGIVVSYDASAQTADVRPGVRRPLPTDEDGAYVTEDLPVIPAVPVCWPRGNGQHFAPGLAPGDGVLIVVCDIDYTTWHRTGSVSDPADLRRHALAHAVCVPGFAPASAALAPSARDLKAADAEIGGSTDAAGLASMLDKLIAVLKTSGVGGSTNVPGVLATAFPSLAGSTTPTPATSTGSAVLKLGS